MPSTRFRTRVQGGVLAALDQNPPAAGSKRRSRQLTVNKTQQQQQQRKPRAASASSSDKNSRSAQKDLFNPPMTTPNNNEKTVLRKPCRDEATTPEPTPPRPSLEPGLPSTVLVSTLVGSPESFESLLNVNDDSPILSDLSTNNSLRQKRRGSRNDMHSTSGSSNDGDDEEDLSLQPRPLFREKDDHDSSHQSDSDTDSDDDSQDYDSLDDSLDEEEEEEDADSRDDDSSADSSGSETRDEEEDGMLIEDDEEEESGEEESIDADDEGSVAVIAATKRDMEECDDEYVPDASSSETEDEELEIDDEEETPVHVVRAKQTMNDESKHQPIIEGTEDEDVDEEEVVAVAEILDETHLEGSDADEVYAVAEIVQSDDDTDDEHVMEEDRSKVDADRSTVGGNDNDDASIPYMADDEVDHDSHNAGKEEEAVQVSIHRVDNIVDEDAGEEIVAAQTNANSICAVPSSDTNVARDIAETDMSDQEASPGLKTNTVEETVGREPSEAAVKNAENTISNKSAQQVLSGSSGLLLDGSIDSPASKDTALAATSLPVADHKVTVKRNGEQDNSESTEDSQVGGNSDKHFGVDGSIRSVQSQKSVNTSTVSENDIASEASQDISRVKTRNQPKLRRIRSEGEVKHGQWSVGSKIGTGSFGTVRVGMNTKTGKLMAVKTMELFPSIMTDVRREVDLLKTLKHDNIVHYLGAEIDGKHLHIFQEWVPGGSVTSLLHKFGPFSMTVVRNYLFQAVTGLAYLHENGVLHRDIKGGNILINNEGVVKLADFGSSRRLAHLQADMMEKQTMRGTPYFMAPEVFEEIYGIKADIWSIGCVAFQMATGSPPWRELKFTNQMVLFRHLSSTTGPPSFDWPLHRHDTAHFPSLLEKCFNRDPTKRPTAEELLLDSFFTAHVASSDDEQSRARNLFSPGGDESVSTWGSANGTNDAIMVGRTDTSSETFLSPPLPQNIRSDSFRQEIVSPLPASPNLDPTGWPSWARQEHALAHEQRRTKPVGIPRSPLPTRSVSKNGQSLMDSLARSEDSSIKENPFRRSRPRLSNESGTSNQTGSTLDGLAFLDEKSNMSASGYL